MARLTALASVLGTRVAADPPAIFGLLQSNTHGGAWRAVSIISSPPPMAALEPAMNLRATGNGQACFSAGSASGAGGEPQFPEGGLVSRYRDLVESGDLRPDPTQADTINRLQELSDQLHGFKGRVDAHNEEVKVYQARREALLKELEAAEERKSEAGSQSESATGWQVMRQLLEAAGLGGGQARQSTLTPEQKAILAARRREQQADRSLGPPPLPPQPPKGVYIHGSVGSGKSLVMDMFYGTVAAQGLLPYHRRVHFNAAMLEMHSWLTKIDRHLGSAAFSGEGDIIDYKAIEGIEDSFQGELRDAKDNGRNAVIALRRATRALALNPRQQTERLARSNASVIRRAARAVIRNHLDLDSLSRSDKGQPITPSLLCFDELQVTDVFAAVALKGLLEVLTSEGTVMVMTSNRAPTDLNSQGLHEDLFDHFVSSLEDTCDVTELASDTDYRRLAYSSQYDKPLQLYHSPLSPHTNLAIERMWSDMTAGEATPSSIQVMFGRQLDVPMAANGIARFAFLDLCAKPLGAADYIAISQQFHTVFITDIPSFSMQIRDQARRFITLIDEMYNHRVRLICSAQDTPDQLFTHTEGNEEAILDLMDLESLQSETAVEGSGLRRDVMADGGVAPVATTKKAMAAAAHHFGGSEEKFAFKRAVSRMYEMQTELYIKSRAQGGAGGVEGTAQGPATSTGL